MSDQFERTRTLIGEENLSKLRAAKVLVFGVGGVGGYVCEALARAGVGTIDIVDKDVVDITNINRQIIATHDTIGKPKTEVAAKRAISINPEITIKMYNVFYLPQNADMFDFSQYDYIIDAVDTVSAKVDIIVKATKSGVPVISSMGAGNKLDPTAFEVSDIYDTSVCPLARVMRRELKQRGIEKLKVVYSKEPAIKPIGNSNERLPGSIAFVPSVAGLIIASEVIKDLIK